MASLRELVIGHGIAWLIGCISLWLAWTGFVGSDDSYYVNAARGWLHAFPHVAENIGTARFVVALPISLTFALFGDREFTAVLSSCLFLLATASLTLSLLRPRIGLEDAVAGSVVFVTIPLFALKSTIPSADLPELFFVVLSFWLFLRACERPKRAHLLLASGASAGLAFLAHETTAALLVFYGLLFLAGKRIRRIEYWVMALGFVAVMASECVYYWVVAGNPWHRLAMLAGMAAFAGDRVHVGFLQIAAGGTIHVWAPIDPIVMFFTKQEFALLGVVAVPAMAWALRPIDERALAYRGFARLIAILGIVWFVFAEVVLDKLILLPRYYMVPAYCFYVVSAIWVAKAIRPRWPRAAVALIAVFVSGNLLGIAIDNKNPRFGERALVEYLQQSSGGDTHGSLHGLLRRYLGQLGARGLQPNQGGAARSRLSVLLQSAQRRSSESLRAGDRSQEICSGGIMAGGMAHAGIAQVPRYRLGKFRPPCPPPVPCRAEADLAESRGGCISGRTESASVN